MVLTANLMSKLYIVDLEPIETRYTGEWKTHLPSLLRSQGFDVVVIDGSSTTSQTTSKGAFLNFGATNIYKAQQIEKLGQLFSNGAVEQGSQFIFTDAWHTGILNLKYMASLLEVEIKIHALWHAGSYDPHDFLGRLIGSEHWVRHTEKSFFYAVDYNYFATEFHINMFCQNLFNTTAEKLDRRLGKIIRSGWCMEYMPTLLAPYKTQTKKNLLLFPHRVAPEKQVEIFLDLQKSLPEYEFIVCQDKTLTKHEYHTLLSQAKIIFSANKQETLGISWYEGVLVNAIPFLPDRLSYSEMALSDFLYPSEWTDSYDAYLQNKSKLIDKLIYQVTHYDSFLPLLDRQASYLNDSFFSCSDLLTNLKART